MDAPRLSHAIQARTLTRRTRTGSLSTLALDPAGFPFGSLVAVADDELGRPLLLLSTLAEHTHNLQARPEASLLLVGEAPTADPLSAPRLTLVGPCTRVADDEVEAVRATFIGAHPEAEGYAGFRDFAFYRLDPAAVRFVGGFGRMSWVDAQQYRDARPDPISPLAPGILEHMNDDHAEAVLAYARALGGIESATAASLTAVDALGFDLIAQTPEGPRPLRVAFRQPVATSDEVRREMVALVRLARGEQGLEPRSAARRASPEREAS